MTLTLVVSSDNVENFVYIFQNSWYVTWTLSLFYAVDAFFWIGGFILAYLMLEEKLLKAFSAR